MVRILIGLASLNTLVLLGAFAVGFACEGRANVSVDAPLSAAQRLFTLHLLSGLAAALLTLLLHSLVLTYFIGTGRWIQEVIAAYRLPAALWEQSRRLKTRALPFVLGSIALIIATATVGAATDRGIAHPNYHLALGTLAVMFSFWSYVREYQVVQENSDLIQQIMSEVTRMRRERGLDP